MSPYNDLRVDKNVCSEEREAALSVSPETTDMTYRRSDGSLLDGAKDVGTALEKGFSKGPLGDVMSFFITMIGIGAHIFAAREIAYLYQNSGIIPTIQDYNFIFLAWFVLRLGCGTITQNIFDPTKVAKNVTKAMRKPWEFVKRNGLYAAGYYSTVYLSMGNVVEDPAMKIALFFNWVRDFTQ